MFTVTDLGDFQPHAINNAGQVVGTGRPGHAVFWDPKVGVVQDLGTLPGDVSSDAWDINAAGVVIGNSHTPSGTNRGFLWDPTTGVMRDLTAIIGSSFIATALNDLGQAVGSKYDAVGDNRALLWTSSTSTLQDLGSLGGPSSLTNDVNDAGAVVGSSIPATGNPHPFLWTPAAGMKDLTGADGDATACNAAGVVVGTGTPTALHAFRWDATNGAQDLGTLGGDYSFAHDVNSVGAVVGGSRLTPGGATLHAFLVNTTMIDLNALLPPGSPWELNIAWGINDAGWIVGEGTHAGKGRAFLLRPTVLLPHRLRDLPTILGIYNPFWWIETHGGLLPPGPPGPWSREAMAAVALAEVAASMSPQLRADALELAVRQLKLATTALEEHVGRLRREG